MPPRDVMPSGLVVSTRLQDRDRRRNDGLTSLTEVEICRSARDRAGQPTTGL